MESKNCLFLLLYIFCEEWLWDLIASRFLSKMLSSSDSEISELDSPPWPGILFDVVSGDPNIVDGKFEESPVPFLSRNAGAFFLTGVDVTGTYVYSSSVVVDESVTHCSTTNDLCCVPI